MLNEIGDALICKYPTSHDYVFHEPVEVSFATVRLPKMNPGREIGAVKGHGILNKYTGTHFRLEQSRLRPRLPPVRAPARLYPNLPHRP